MYNGTLTLTAASWESYQMFSGSLDTIARLTQQQKILVIGPDKKTWCSVEFVEQSHDACFCEKCQDKLLGGHFSAGVNV